MEVTHGKGHNPLCTIVISPDRFGINFLEKNPHIQHCPWCPSSLGGLAAPRMGGPLEGIHWLRRARYTPPNPTPPGITTGACRTPSHAAGVHWRLALGNGVCPQSLMCTIVMHTMRDILRKLGGWRVWSGKTASPALSFSCLLASVVLLSVPLIFSETFYLLHRDSLSRRPRCLHDRSIPVCRLACPQHV